MKKYILYIFIVVIYICCTKTTKDYANTDVSTHYEVDSIANLEVHLSVNGVILGEKITPFIEELKNQLFCFHDPKEMRTARNDDYLECYIFHKYLNGATIKYYVHPIDSIVYKIDFLFADVAHTTRQSYIDKYGESCSLDQYQWIYKNQSITTAYLDNVRLKIPSYYQEDLVYKFIATYEDFEATKKHEIYIKEIEDRYEKAFIRKNTPSSEDI